MMKRVPYILHTDRAVSSEEMAGVRRAVDAAEADGRPIVLSGWSVTRLGPSAGEVADFLIRFHDSCEQGVPHLASCWTEDPGHCELVQYVRRLEASQ